MASWQWKSVLLSASICGSVYVARGFQMAKFVGGKYAWHVAVEDFFLFALVVVVLRGFDYGVDRLRLGMMGEAKGWRGLTGQIIRFVVVLLVSAPLLISVVQFRPQRVGCGETPADWGMPHEDVALEVEGLPISGWYIPARRDNRPAIVVTHGLGANKQNFLVAARMVHELDYPVLIVDFRAHGDSAGRVTTFGWREAEEIRAAHDWLRARHPGQPVYALAFSMGGVATLRAAALYGCFDKMVINCAYARAEEVALHAILGGFGPAKHWAWQSGRCWGYLWTGTDLGQADLTKLMPSLANKPLLLVYGAADQVIPPSQSEALRAASGRDIPVWIIPGIRHNGMLEVPEYPGRLRRFFDGPAPVPK